MLGLFSLGLPTVLLNINIYHIEETSYTSIVYHLENRMTSTLNYFLLLFATSIKNFGNAIWRFSREGSFIKRYNHSMPAFW